MTWLDKPGSLGWFRLSNVLTCQVLFQYCLSQEFSPSVCLPSPLWSALAAARRARHLGANWTHCRPKHTGASRRKYRKAWMKKRQRKAADKQSREERNYSCYHWLTTTDFYTLPYGNIKKSLIYCCLKQKYAFYIS